MPKYVIERDLPGAGRLSAAESQADDAASIEEHATTGGFPCNHIRQVRTIIDPVTAEA